LLLKLAQNRQGISKSREIEIVPVLPLAKGIYWIFWTCSERRFNFSRPAAFNGLLSELAANL
jgi:hypothetical protein